jgi:hypothetical protein
MCSRGMFVHRPCRLSAAVAILTAELSCGDKVLAEWALERRKAIHHLNAVMSHIFNCSLVSGQPRTLLGTKVTPRQQLLNGVNAKGFKPSVPPDVAS